MLFRFFRPQTAELNVSELEMQLIKARDEYVSIHEFYQEATEDADKEYFIGMMNILAEKCTAIRGQLMLESNPVAFRPKFLPSETTPKNLGA